MTSVIHYRFKNTTEPFSTLTFDGQSLPLAQLKALIVQHKHLHKQSAHDFDLVVADAQTGDEYVRDDERVVKNAQVVVRRVPNTKAKTITTHLAAEPEQSAHASQTGNAGLALLPLRTAVATDADRYDLFTFSSSFVCVRPAATSSPATSGPAAIPISAPIAPTSDALPPPATYNRPQRRPPPGYLCKRCGSPDHYVQHCPHYPTPPHSTTHRPAQPTQPAPAPSQPVGGPPADLLCSLCHNLYHAPMVVPCCFTSFCDECVRQALLWEDAYTCPSCQHRPVRLDELRPNDKLRQRVEEWMASRGQQQAAVEAGVGDEVNGAGVAAGDRSSVAQGVPVVEDDVSVILAEPSVGQLQHQARRDKQHNASNFRCFTCGETGHRAAQCPKRQQLQQQQHQLQQPMLPHMQQPPTHDPYMANGYAGGPLYNDMGMPHNNMGMYMPPMGPGGYGGMMPMYDNWGNFMGMQPMPPMPPQQFYQPPQPYMDMPPPGPVRTGLMGMAEAMPQVAGMAGGVNGEMTGAGARIGDPMQTPLNTAPLDQQVAVVVAQSTFPPASTAAVSSLLSVMPFVPPRSPPSSSPASISQTVPASSSTSTTAVISQPTRTSSAASAASPPLHSPSNASPTAASAATPPPTQQHPKPAAPAKLAAPPAPELTVASYGYMPSTWSGQPRPLLLCTLSNHQRVLYAPSALLGSAFRLAQLLPTPSLHRVAATGVPPKGQRSGLLVTREGMVEWRRREGEAGAGVGMAEDWKGKGGGWERVVEWMRGERQVRMVKAGEEWKEEAPVEEKQQEVKPATKEKQSQASRKAQEEASKVQDVGDVSRGRRGERMDQANGKVSDLRDSSGAGRDNGDEVERKSSKRRVETDAQGRLHVKLHRREYDSLSQRDNANHERREDIEDGERRREQQHDTGRASDQRPRVSTARDDSEDSDSHDRRKRKRGGKRERGKLKRREERHRDQRNSDEDDGRERTAPQSGQSERGRNEGRKKIRGEDSERKGDNGGSERVMKDDVSRGAGDDDRYRPPAMDDNDENDVFAMVMR